MRKADEDDRSDQPPAVPGLPQPEVKPTGLNSPPQHSKSYPPANVESLKQIYTVHLTAWEDETARADTLLERRKVMISVLAFVAGIGLFNTGSLHPERFASLNDSLWNAVRTLLIEGFCFFIVGAYLLVSNRSRCREFGCRWMRYVRKQIDLRVHLLMLMGSGRRKEKIKTKRKIKALVFPKWPQNQHQRASREMVPGKRELLALMEATESQVLREQTARLRAAYSQLVVSNNKLDDRTTQGSQAVFIGYICLAIVLAILIWSM